MAQEENYIAIVSERLSRPDDTRYVIIDKQTQQEVDNCNGHGYKSASSAHKSFSFKQRQSGQQCYGRSGYSQGYATRGAATMPTAVHTYRSTPNGHGISTNRGQAAYGQTARQVPMNGQPSSGNSQPRDFVSPFVQEASAVCQRPTVVCDDGVPQVTRSNSWSGYAPRRIHRRPQDVSQENTQPPTPDLFDFINK